MPLDRSLWVDDKYAVRCRDCHKEFGLLRRRHHCRQCGQIFCSACLRKAVAAVEAGDKPAPAALKELLLEKVCARCAALLTERFVTPSLTTGRATTGGGAEESERREGGAAMAPQPAAPETDAVAGRPSARAPAKAEGMSRPALTRHHKESVEEKGIAYSIQGVEYYRRRAQQQRECVGTWASGVLEKLTKSQGRAAQGMDDTFDFLTATQCGAETGDDGWTRTIAAHTSALPLEWRGEALRVYVARMRYLFRKHSITDASVIRGVVSVTWRAVQGTQVAWGGHLLDHVCISGFPAARRPDHAISCVSGLVLARQLVSNRMPMAWLHRPRVLLLGGEVTVAADGGPSTLGGSLSEYMASYRGHLDKLFQRIKVWAPQVIVVEKGMHHYLQKRIADDGGMSLLLHAGKVALNRLAAGCHASVVADLQYVGLAELQEPSRSPLGVCDCFRVLEGDGCGVCVFEGLPQPWFTSLLIHTLAGVRFETLELVLRGSLVTAAHLMAQAQCLSSFGWRLEGAPVNEEEAEQQSSLAISSLLSETAPAPAPRRADDNEVKPLLKPTMNMALDQRASGSRGAVDCLVVQKVMHERIGTSVPGGNDDKRDEDGDEDGDGDDENISGSGEGDGRPSAEEGESSTTPHPQRGSQSSVPPPPTSATATAEGTAHFAIPPSLPPAPKAGGKAREGPRRSRRLGFALYDKWHDQSVLSFLAEQVRASWATTTAPSAAGGSGGERRFLFVHKNRRVLVSHAAVPGAVAADGPTQCSLPQSAEALRKASQSFRARLGHAVTGEGGEWASAVRGVALCGGPESTVADARTCTAGGAAALGTLSLGAFLDGLFYSSPELVHNARPLRPPFALSFLVCCDPLVGSPAQERDKQPQPPQPTLSFIRFTVSPIQLLPLLLPAAGCRSREGRSATRASDVLENAISELELDILRVHSSLLQCIADLTAEGSGGASRSSSFMSRRSTPAPDAPESSTEGVSGAGSKDRRGSGLLPALPPPKQPDGVESLALLQTRAVELVRSFATSVACLNDVDAVRWHHLRPLVQDAKTLLTQHELGPSALSRDLSDRQWVYSVSRSSAARLGEPSSLLALALSQGAKATEAGLGKPPMANLTRTGDTVPPVAHAGVEGKPSSAMDSTPSEIASTDPSWRTTALKALCSPPPASLNAAPASPWSTTSAPVTRSVKHVLDDLCDGSGQPACRVVVEVLFPEKFAALQRLLTGNDAATFIDSLRRCRVHKPQGGKTNSGFFLTADGRYLVKQVKLQEWRHFPAWAPQYFAHMCEGDGMGDVPVSGGATRHLQRPASLLAKMLGLFSVRTLPGRHVDPESPYSPCTPHLKTRSVLDARQAVVGCEAIASPIATSSAPAAKNSSFDSVGSPSGGAGRSVAAIAGGASDVHYYVLMENTASRWATTSSSQTAPPSLSVAAFDLKGSQRNRNAPPGSLVRLDGDFVKEFLHKGDFFFCSVTQKRLLMEGLSRDVQLLRSASIMDYSLLVVATDGRVGTCAGTHDEGDPAAAKTPQVELSVIDYLHPFTGAKLLESKMKSGLDTVLGHAGHDPTIIDPAAYGERFLRWMNCYFCEVPDSTTPFPSSSQRS